MRWGRCSSSGSATSFYKRGAAAGVPAHQFLMVQTWVFLPAVTLYGVGDRHAGLRCRVAVGCGGGRLHLPSASTTSPQPAAWLDQRERAGLPAELRDHRAPRGRLASRARHAVEGCRHCARAGGGLAAARRAGGAGGRRAAHDARVAGPRARRDGGGRRRQLHLQARPWRGRDTRLAGGGPGLRRVGDGHRLLGQNRTAA